MAQQIDVSQQNYINRVNLIQTGLHMIKQLQPVTAAAMGATIRIPLERMGVMTSIKLDVSVPVDITAAATVSPFAPYNLFENLSYTDYSGLQRVMTSGYQMHMLNAFRHHQLPNNSAKNAGFLTATETGIDTNILSLPSAVGAGTINFTIDIPIAYDATSDLRGAVLAQTIYGDHYVTVTLPTALVGTDPLINPYTAGTIALNGQITVQAYQHYIMPQNGVNNLPMIDLSTVYAIEGNYSDSSNISAGQAKYINWVNNRSILSVEHIFNNGAVGGTLNQTDVNRIVLLGNSNTNIREMSPRYIRNKMRGTIGCDMPSGVYHISSRSQPISTQLYGNVQTRFDIAAAAAGSYFLSQFESMYLTGTPLPGVIQ